VSKLENQWVEIFRAGDYAAQGKFTEADLDQIVRNYQASNPEFEEAPATIGHSEGTGAPAWAWWSAIKREGKLLLGKMKDVQPQFEEMVRSRMFPKRSVGLVKRANSGLNLQHVAFLGAKAPEVKGLADCKFSDRTASLMQVEFGAKPTKGATTGIKFSEAHFRADQNSVDLANLSTDRMKEKSITFGEAMKQILNEQPELALRAEVYTGARPTRGATTEIKFSEAHFRADQNSVDLANLSTDRMKEKSITFGEAMKQILNEQPELALPAPRFTRE
jgi:hypothetical protein